MGSPRRHNKVHRLFMVAAAGCLFGLVACGGDDDSGGAPDLSIGPITSACGNPGDSGNEFGVGKFCETGNDCTGSKAKTCSLPVKPGYYFCTVPCTPGDNAACGSGALCIHDSTLNSYGCVPTKCNPPDAGI